MKNNSRYGAYGVIVRDHKLLLNQHKSGYYLGKWSLPGGRIEFGESPEKALLREIYEETGMRAGGLKLMTTHSTSGTYLGDPYHQIGIFYWVEQVVPVEGAIGEEEHDWFSLDSIDREKLAPFAIKALQELGRTL